LVQQLHLIYHWINNDRYEIVTHTRSLKSCIYSAIPTEGDVFFIDNFSISLHVKHKSSKTHMTYSW